MDLYTEVAELGFESGCFQLPSQNSCCYGTQLGRPKWGGGPAPDSIRCSRKLLSMGGALSCGCAQNAGTSDILRRTQPASGTPLPAPCLLPWTWVGITLWDSLSSCFTLLIPPRNSKQGEAQSSLYCGELRGHGTGPPISKIVRARLSQDGKGWD